MDNKDKCYCGHLEIWHFMNTCKWCAKMNARYPNFNFRPHHRFEVQVPGKFASWHQQTSKQFDESVGKYLSIKPGPLT
jgi:hypothetical protein